MSFFGRKETKRGRHSKREEFYGEEIDSDLEFEDLEEFEDEDYHDAEFDGEDYRGDSAVEEEEEDDYEEDDYEEDDYEEVDYEEDDYLEDDYDEEDWSEHDTEGYEYGVRSTKKNSIDLILVGMGVLVLLVAVITGTVFMVQRNIKKSVAAFSSAGEVLDGVTVIGESGLLALSDARLNMVNELPEETETQETEESEEGMEMIQVSMKTSTIVKDLKIKFVNSKTGKLIASVPFELEVTLPSGKKDTWKDENSDGVIYKDKLEGGKYKLKVLPLMGDKAENYGLPQGEETVEVKAKADYEKVDVTEEIKTEAEVNVAVEDTAVAVQEESKLTDTVPFVASTKVEATGDGGYKSIAKTEIKNPGEAAKRTLTGFYRASATTVVKSRTIADIKGPDSVKVGETIKLESAVTIVEETTTPGGGDVSENGTSSGMKTTSERKEAVNWAVAPAEYAEIGQDGVLKGKKAGTVTVTASYPEAASKTKTIQVTENTTLSLSATSQTLKVDAEVTLTATTNKPDSLTWGCDAPTVLQIQADKNTCKLKGLQAGKAKVTVKVDGLTQICEVTVEAKNGLSLSVTTLSVPVGKTGTFDIVTVPESATVKSAVSSDKAIAEVTVSGKKATVKGIKIGTADITITDSNNLTAVCKVTVTNSAETDTTSLLLDKNGKQVYVKENGQYRKAVFADYYKATEFFIQSGQFLYTGWQNIDGKTYYYLQNNQYVTGEQVIQGAKYTFASDGTLVQGSGNFGIDVSKWNGKIDWDKVKNGGVSYAIIRCGYRGSSTGALIEDPKFAANISGANKAGIKAGVYFFSQAINEAEAIEEASMVLSLVKKYKLSYPIFLDVEPSGGRGDAIDSATRTAVIQAFCNTIKKYGYSAGVYANKTWFSSKMNVGSLGGCKIWLAQYAAAPTYSGRYDIWQYSAKGSVPGISGNVDLNLSYLGY